MKLDKGFNGMLENILADMEDSEKEKAKAGIEKAVKATIKKKLKKKRRAFVRRVVVIGVVAAAGYLAYTRSEKVRAAVNDAKEKVMEKIPTEKIPLEKIPFLKVKEEA